MSVGTWISWKRSVGRSCTLMILRMARFKATQAFGNRLSVDTAFNPVFFDVKDPRNEILLKRKEQEKFWGFEICLPFSWFFGTERKFELRLKPYLMKFNIISSENTLGSQLELGFSY